MTEGRPVDQYHAVMSRIRSRLDVISQIRRSNLSTLSALETAAFHLRKVIEGIAFGCLIACENGVKRLPRDAQGQWNADNIFSRLDRRGVLALPNPSAFRSPTSEEREEMKRSIGAELAHVIEGQPDACLNVDDIRSMYRRTHGWLHEENPYVARDADQRAVEVENLWSDVDKIEGLLGSHAIGISGEMFFCVLRDKDRTTVAAASKVAA